MPLVIETTTKQFILPAIDIDIANHSSATGGWIPDYSMPALNSVLKIKVADFDLATYESFLTTENIIPGEHPNWSGYRGPFYKTSEPYKMKNGYNLYFNVIYKSPGDGGFRSFPYVIIDDSGNEPPSMSFDFTPVLNADGSSYYHPYIFMFSQPGENSNYAYICYVAKETAYLPDGVDGFPRGDFYNFYPDQIDKGSDKWNYLFTDVPGADNPFYPGGESGVGGGGGNFDNTSTPIDIPSLPSISAASTGFISLFNPTLPELNQLAAYLWSDLFEIDGWKKLFANPMDAILGLSILPVPIPSGGTREVKVGNIGTGISLTTASTQFVEIDCGSINVNEYWGAYLDYEPYTHAQIFLPYIGTRPISVDEIMGKTVRVVYHVDILTGACCAFVKCGDSVLYTYNGQCSIPIPITSANYTSVVNGAISIAASIGSMVATGGASAPVAIPSIANSVVNQMKPNIEKSGSISGPAGVLNIQVPYLILTRPRQALPAQQNEFIGFPSLITVQLTELSGYTEVQSIHLENISATQEELAEIQSLLEGGVIF